MVNPPNARYFYGLRRTDDGELFIVKADPIKSGDPIQINKEGDPTKTLKILMKHKILEGRNVNHEKVYPNLNYEQFRWDNRSTNYYIDDSGNLVARVNEGYEYPTGV